jgi:hypothetical protein
MEAKKITARLGGENDLLWAGNLYTWKQFPPAADYAPELLTAERTEQ